MSSYNAYFGKPDFQAMSFSSLFCLFCAALCHFVFFASVGQHETCDESPFRNFDVYHYDLHVNVEIEKEAIYGSNTISFTVDTLTSTIRIDLFDELHVDSVTMTESNLAIERKSNHFLLHFAKACLPNQLYSLTVYYSGKPRIAADPPWDGGFTWAKDSLGNPWIGTSCQSLGASMWWPNNDQLEDRPDSMDIYIGIPTSHSKLYAVSNGELVSIDEHNHHNYFHWHCSYPINNYNVTLNIGKYAHFQRSYFSPIVKKPLKMDFYVLQYNKNKAKTHFLHAYDMLACYEHHFGPYPFWDDGFGLVEAPFWGMEHQGAIAYGNNYQRNDFNFDFILIHESAHEYWGNSVCSADRGELWLHEAFATYAEALFVEWTQGKLQAQNYLNGHRSKIKNNEALIGPLGVNYTDYEGTDMYYKGAWMLHSMRSMVNNDSLWFGFIRHLSRQYEMSFITTALFLSECETHLGIAIIPFIKHLIFEKSTPVLEFAMKKGKKLKFRFVNVTDAFSCPINISYSDKIQEVVATSEWKELISKEGTLVGPVQSEDVLIEYKAVDY